MNIMRQLKLALLAATSLVALGSIASAADLARPVYRAPVAYVAGYNWTGFYVGGHFGGGWGNKDWTETGNSSGFNGFGDNAAGSGGVDGLDPVALGSTDVGSHTVTGPLGGFQVGYNYQFGRWLIGIEGQFSWSDMKGNHQNTTSFSSGESDDFVNAMQSDRFYSKVKNLGTIAVRLGLVSGAEGRTLFYVKGGAAYAKDDYSLLANGSATGCEVSDDDCFGATLNQRLTGSTTRWGPMAGIGLEFALFDNWTAKVEYNYLALGTKTVSLAGSECITFPADEGTTCTPITRSFDIKQNLNVIKFGINYRFGNYYTPVVTK
jgi:outer membrane immunogenic protein